MKLNLFLTIYAINLMVMGLAFLAIPSEAAALYGMALQESGVIVTRLLSGAFIGMGIVAWQLRDAPASGSIRGVFVGLTVIEGLHFVVFLHSQLAGTMNVYGWSGVAITLSFFLGFLYFMFVKRAGL